MHDTLSNFLAREIRAREIIRERLRRRKLFELPLSLLQKYLIGEFPIGNLVINFGNEVVRLRRGIDSRLLLLVGLPGSGKTNLLRCLALSGMMLEDRVAIFSRKGYEFSPLVLMPKVDFHDMKARDTRLNPFYPPVKNIATEEWYARVAGAISTEGWLVYASATNFQKILSRYAENNPARLITPSRLIEFLQQRRAFKLIDVDEKVRNRLEALTSGDAKYIFDTNEVYDFEFYARNNFNFNFESLGPNQLLYFIAIWLEMLICYKQHTHDQGHHIVVLDDFSDLVSEQEDSKAKMSELIKTITVYSRKLKIDLWIVAQSSFGLSKYVLDNVSTVIQFRTGALSEDVMKKLTELSDQEAKLLELLPRGYCAVNKRLIHA
jgi:hypothetical protein